MPSAVTNVLAVLPARRSPRPTSRSGFASKLRARILPFSVVSAIDGGVAGLAICASIRRLPSLTHVVPSGIGTLRFQTGGFSTAGEEGSGGFDCWARAATGVTSNRAAIREAGLIDAILVVSSNGRSVADAAD